MCAAARQICVRPRFGYFAIPRAAARGSIGRVQAETGCQSERGEVKPSQQGRAGLRLQNALPDARIAYVSATGATTVPGLAYAGRLGLWASRGASTVCHPDRLVWHRRFVKKPFRQLGTHFVNRSFRCARQFVDRPSPVVHLDLRFRRRRIDPDDPVGADKQPRLPDGICD